MIERCFVFIKPENDLGKAAEILGYLEDRLKTDGEFESTIPVHIKGVNREVIEKHYSHIMGVPHYQPTIGAFVNGDLIALVYTGENICERIRKIIGNTDPQKAEEGTVRKVFSRDSLENAKRYKRYLNNVVHASESGEEAEEEIGLWAGYLNN